MNGKRDTSILVNLHIAGEELRLAWRFPGKEEAPVYSSVPLSRVREWIASQVEVEGMMRGATQIRDVAVSSGDAGGFDPEQRLNKLGSAMLAAMVSEEVAARWNLTVAKDENGPALHLVFQWSSSLGDNRLDPAGIPFEALHSGDPGRLPRIRGPFVLAKGVSIERRITDGQGGGPALPSRWQGGKILLFVGPIAPEDSGRKQELEEAQAVEDAIRSASLGGAVTLRKVVSSARERATFGAFCQAARDCHIVHFIGHGDADKGLLFERERQGDGKGDDWVSIENVAATLAGSSVWLLVLNCCQTAAISSFACGLPAVVGHQYRITGAAVKSFEVAFFEELLTRGRVADAVWAGRDAIRRWEGGPPIRWESRTPVLFLQADAEEPARWRSIILSFAGLVMVALLLFLVGPEKATSSREELNPTGKTPSGDAPSALAPSNAPFATPPSRPSVLPPPAPTATARESGSTSAPSAAPASSATPTVSEAGTTAAPPVASAAAAPEQVARRTNSFGMIFVALPATTTWICIFETKRRDFEELMPVGRSRDPGFPQGDSHPAAGVSWDEAKLFCARLTQLEISAGQMSAEEEYRLPTNEEWSMAVGLPSEQGSTPKEKDGRIPGRYPWGAGWPPIGGAGNYAASLGVDPYQNTSPVGSFPANAKGIFDLGGNVAEWCEDRFAEGEDQRVVRGGSWASALEAELLSSARWGRPPDTHDSSIGFRCARARRQ